jgi:hypothetical protein
MNKKYLIFSAIFWIGLICFINFVYPDFLWSKIVFFVLLFFCFFTTAYIFPKKDIINLFIALYLLSTVLLQYFRQFSVLNLIFTTALFVCLFFVCRSKSKKL